MTNDQLPMVWVAQDTDGSWKWCVGEQSGGNPTYLSTNSFKTAQYAKENARLTLSRGSVPFVFAPNLTVDDNE